jgi:hypothetical protein
MMSEQIKLTDRMQALLMLLVFVLPAFITWAAMGMLTAKVSVGLLVSAVLSGVLAFVKELLGWKPTRS